MIAITTAVWRMAGGRVKEEGGLLVTSVSCHVEATIESVWQSRFCVHPLMIVNFRHLLGVVGLLS